MKSGGGDSLPPPQEASVPWGARTDEMGQPWPSAQHSATLTRSSGKRHRRSSFSEYDDGFSAGQPGRRSFRQRVKLRLLRVADFLDRALPVLHPKSVGLRTWTVTIQIFVVFSAVTVPLSASYGIPNTLGFNLTTWLMDLCFMLDVCVNFRTAYYDHQGTLIRNGQMIARHYFFGWFWLDFLASLSFDAYLAWLGVDAGNEHHHGAMQALGVVKTPRLLRLAKLLQLLNRWRHAKVLSIVLLFFFMALVAHWLGCIWYMLYKYGGDLTTPIDEWSFGSVVNDGLINVYVSNYYSSFLLLVGDNIGAYNNYERAFFIVASMLGTFFYSAIVGQMAVLVATLNVTVSRHNQRYALIQDMLRYMDVPLRYKQRVQKYYDDLLARSHPGPEGLVSVAELPARVRTNLACFLHKAHLRKMPLFAGCELGFLDRLCELMTISTFAASEVIFKSEDLSSECYFVREGYVMVTSGFRQEASALLGEGALLGEEALLSGSRRTTNCVALTFVDAAVLRRRHLDMLMREYPDSGALVRARIQLQLTRLEASRKWNCWLDFEQLQALELQSPDDSSTDDGASDAASKDRHSSGRGDPDSSKGGPAPKSPAAAVASATPSSADATRLPGGGRLHPAGLASSTETAEAAGGLPAHLGASTEPSSRPAGGLLARTLGRLLPSRFINPPPALAPPFLSSDASAPPVHVAMQASAAAATGHQHVPDDVSAGNVSAATTPRDVQPTLRPVLPQRSGASETTAGPLSPVQSLQASPSPSRGKATRKVLLPPLAHHMDSKPAPGTSIRAVSTLSAPANSSVANGSTAGPPGSQGGKHNRTRSSSAATHDASGPVAESTEQATGAAGRAALRDGEAESVCRTEALPVVAAAATAVSSATTGSTGSASGPGIQRVLPPAAAAVASPQSLSRTTASNGPQSKVSQDGADGEDVYIEQLLQAGGSCQAIERARTAGAYSAPRVPGKQTIRTSRPRSSSGHAGASLAAPVVPLTAVSLALLDGSIGGRGLGGSVRSTAHRNAAGGTAAAWVLQRAGSSQARRAADARRTAAAAVAAAGVPVTAVADDPVVNQTRTSAAGSRQQQQQQQHSELSSLRRSLSQTATGGNMMRWASQQGKHSSGGGYDSPSAAETMDMGPFFSARLSLRHRQGGTHQSEAAVQLDAVLSALSLANESLRTPADAGTVRSSRGVAPMAASGVGASSLNRVPRTTGPNRSAAAATAASAIGMHTHTAVAVATSASAATAAGGSRIDLATYISPLAQRMLDEAAAARASHMTLLAQVLESLQAYEHSVVAMQSQLNGMEDKMSQLERSANRSPKLAGLEDIADGLPTAQDLDAMVAAASEAAAVQLANSSNKSMPSHGGSIGSSRRASILLALPPPSVVAPMSGPAAPAHVVLHSSSKRRSSVLLTGLPASLAAAPQSGGPGTPRSRRSSLLHHNPDPARLDASQAPNVTSPAPQD